MEHGNCVPLCQVFNASQRTQQNRTGFDSRRIGIGESHVTGGWRSVVIAALELSAEISKQHPVEAGSSATAGSMLLKRSTARRVTTSTVVVEAFSAPDVLYITSLHVRACWYLQER